MRFTAPFALITLAAAMPTSKASKNITDLLSSNLSLALAHDDVIVFGVHGLYKVVKEDELQTLIDSGALVYGSDEVKAPSPLKAQASLEARDCGRRSVEYSIDSQSDILDWDVQISPAVQAVKAAVSIAVETGYSLSNSISVQESFGISVEGIGSTFSIDYQETWSTSDSTTITYTVPDGFYGVIISQPWTHRIYGTAFSICENGGVTKERWQSSTHTNEQYGNFHWVTGFFKVCLSRTYPIPYCRGRGYHK